MTGSVEIGKKMGMRNQDDWNQFGRMKRESKMNIFIS